MMLIIKQSRCVIAISINSTRINQSINLLSALKDADQKPTLTDSVQLWRSKTFNNIDAYITKFNGQLALKPAIEVRDRQQGTESEVCNYIASREQLLNLCTNAQ